MVVRGISLCLLLLFTNTLYASKVLFIGNSFIGFSQPTLEQFAALNPLGDNEFGYEFSGGISLLEHTRRASTLARIKRGEWDYVVIQDHSLQTLRDPQGFACAVEMLVELIRQGGAEPILFMTWARLENGHYADHQAIISASYRDIGQRLKVPVAQVGEVWFDMYRNNPRVFDRMFKPDGIHQTELGSYAVAASIFRVMYDDQLNWARSLSSDSDGSIVHASAVRLNLPVSAGVSAP